MRIAIWHGLSSGGGKRALYDHVRGLVARGHEVEAWGTPDADRRFLPLSAIVPEHVLPLEADGTRSGLAGLPARLWRAAQAEAGPTIRAMDRHVERCAVEIDRGRFDVVLACSLNPHGATAIGRCTRTPAALYIGEPYRRLYEAQPRLHWANPPVRQPHEGALRYGRRVAAEALKVHERGIQAREERDNAAAFDRILVNSHFSREAVLRTYGLDATVCYLGVDTERFVPRPGFKRDVVLGVGAIIPEKNVELIIRALALIPARPPLVWLANIAKPSYLTKMQALAASARVRFVPRIGVAENEALELIQSARALVYAPHLEPFGLAVLEASACATPVVAVAEAGVRETVIHGVNGLLAEHDAEALACALSRVLDDDALACGLGAGGRRLVEERWTLAHAADRIERQLRLVARHT